jgi:hypothetical protein
VKLMDQPPVRVGSTHQCSGLLVRSEDNKDLMPIPQAILRAIRRSHPKTQEAPSGLPTSHDLFFDGSLLKGQLNRSFEMSHKETDGFECRTRLFRLMDWIEPEWLRRPGIDKQSLRLNGSLSKAQDGLPVSMLDELSKEFISVPHAQ